VHSSGVGHYSRNELFRGFFCGTLRKTFLFVALHFLHSTYRSHKMLPIPRGSREEKLTKLIIISWFVRFYICVYSSSLLSSRKRGVHKMIFYSISSTSVGLFEFFAFFVLTICPFQARKRKTRRVGNQIDGETHMRNLKLKTHKISTDILSCTNY